MAAANRPGRRRPAARWIGAGLAVAVVVAEVALGIDGGGTSAAPAPFTAPDASPLARVATVAVDSPATGAADAAEVLRARLYQGEPAVF